MLKQSVLMSFYVVHFLKRRCRWLIAGKHWQNLMGGVPDGLLGVIAGFSGSFVMVNARTDSVRLFTELIQRGVKPQLGNVAESGITLVLGTEDNVALVKVVPESKFITQGILGTP